MSKRKVKRRRKAIKPKREYKVDKLREEVEDKLTKVGRRLVYTIESERFPTIEMPSRSTGNIVYDPKTRQYILGDKTTERSSRNIRHLRPFTQTVWTATFAQELITTKKSSTLRDVYYNAMSHNIKFKTQSESDSTIVELETLIDHPREDFNIYPEERSSIFGDLTIEYTVPGYEGRQLNLTSMPDGATVGPALSSAEFVKCKAKVVIAVEKGAMFSRFVEEGADRKFRAILVHTAGMAPRATRKVLRRLMDELGLPVYVMTDADPWGLAIAGVLIYGSAAAAHLRELTVPDAVYAGLYASDIERYRLPPMRLNKEDERRVKELMKDPRFQDDPWARELKVFQKNQRKAELESFSRFGLDFVVKKYLPERLAELEKS